MAVWLGQGISGRSDTPTPHTVTQRSTQKPTQQTGPGRKVPSPTMALMHAPNKASHDARYEGERFNPLHRVLEDEFGAESQ